MANFSLRSRDSFLVLKYFIFYEEIVGIKFFLLLNIFRAVFMLITVKRTFKVTKKLMNCSRFRKFWLTDTNQQSTGKRETKDALNKKQLTSFIG